MCHESDRAAGPQRAVNSLESTSRSPHGFGMKHWTNGAAKTTPMSTSRTAFLALLLLVVGCNRGSAGGESNLTVLDSAGIQIVSNPAPNSPTPAFELSDDPILHIGLVEGDPEYLFYDVTSAMRLSDGRIVVLNGGTGELRFYSRDGRHIRTVGGLGEGPGEFRYPYHLGLNDDRIEVMDRERRTWFSTDGDLIDSERLDYGHLRQMTAPDLSVGPLHPIENGGFFALGGKRETRPLPTGITRPLSAFFFLPESRNRIDTLGMFGGIEQINLGSEADPDFYILPFPRRTVWACGGQPGTAYIAENDGYEIRQYDHRGRLSRLIRTRMARLPVDPERVQRFKERTRNGRREAPWARDVDRRVSRLPSPDSIPPYLGLFVDRLGRLWASVQTLPDRPRRSHVFSHRGELLGWVEPPARFRVTDAGSDYVTGVWTDDLGVQHVRTYSLRRSAS